MLFKLLNDDSGFVVSLEETVIATLVLCSVTVCAADLRRALVEEMVDLADAIGALDQSYKVPAIELEGAPCQIEIPGFSFDDRIDLGDDVKVAIICAPTGEKY